LTRRSGSQPLGKCGFIKQIVCSETTRSCGSWRRWRSCRGRLAVWSVWRGTTPTPLKLRRRRASGQGAAVRGRAQPLGQSVLIDQRVHRNALGHAPTGRCRWYTPGILRILLLQRAGATRCIGPVGVRRAHPFRLGIQRCGALRHQTHAALRTDICSCRTHQTTARAGCHGIFLSFEPTSAVNAYSLSGIGTRVSDTIALSQVYQQHTQTCG
jgi:hypothetical protein